MKTITIGRLAVLVGAGFVATACTPGFGLMTTNGSARPMTISMCGAAPIALAPGELKQSNVDRCMAGAAARKLGVAPSSRPYVDDGVTRFSYEIEAFVELRGHAFVPERDKGRYRDHVRKGPLGPGASAVIEWRDDGSIWIMPGGRAADLDENAVQPEGWPLLPIHRGPSGQQDTQAEDD